MLKRLAATKEAEDEVRNGNQPNHAALIDNVEAE
jgi:hypothetical protein